MAIPYIEINNVLQAWAANDPPIEDFTVENVLATVNLSIASYDEVLRYLMSKSGFELIPMKILLCPNNHKGDAFQLDEPIDEEEIFECPCGKDYYYEPQKFLLVFNFTKEFKQNIIKKKKTLKNRELVLV